MVVKSIKTFVLTLKYLEKSIVRWSYRFVSTWIFVFYTNTDKPIFIEIGLIEKRWFSYFLYGSFIRPKG